ncbi:uncharacterized protein [Littorina saxatilis]
MRDTDFRNIMMAEADTVSNASSTLSSDIPGLSSLGDIAVTSDGAFGEDSDSELQAAADRLDTALTLEPDADIQTTLGSMQDSDSVGAASTSSSSARDPHDHNDSDSDDTDHDEDEDHKDQKDNDVDKDKSDVTAVHNGPDKNGGAKDKVDKNGTDSKSAKPKKEKDGSKKEKDGSKKRKNPLRLLKKLTKFDKPKKKEQNSFSEFEQVRIDKLPQVFVAKYLGMREVRGFCGLHHVRKPVDEMVQKVQTSLESKEPVELPLVYVVVSPRGLDIREHKLNKQKEKLPVGMVPIDFISYGVQDIKYWRVFTFIVVRELSSRSKVTECHAYLCDSSLNARKMALSLGASFKVYSRTLKKDGKVHNFQVELRPPDALADSLAEEDA